MDVHHHDLQHSGVLRERNSRGTWSLQVSGPASAQLCSTDEPAVFVSALQHKPRAVTCSALPGSLYIKRVPPLQQLSRAWVLP